MVELLIRQLTDDFDPGQFKDEYHKALKKLIRKKVKGEEIVGPEGAGERADVIDLMDALKASVEAAKRGEKAQRPKSTKKKPSSTDLTGLSKRQLEERARKLEIEGRWKMTKEQLVEAISSTG
jgi:DNA end-binding protein Ku